MTARNPIDLTMEEPLEMPASIICITCGAPQTAYLEIEIIQEKWSFWKVLSDFIDLF